MKERELHFVVFAQNGHSLGFPRYSLLAEFFILLMQMLEVHRGTTTLK
ncbi:MAG: hypothetical protein KAJ64_05440 [Thermoplasmata archaeon]|nr:hypothetical protein [Thermoplasmata archaeon]